MAEMIGPRYLDASSRAVFLFRKADEGSAVTEEGMKADHVLMQKMLDAKLRVHDLLKFFKDPADADLRGRIESLY